MVQSKLILPMCRPCRRERTVRHMEPCAGCGKPIDTTRRYWADARCRICSRNRRDAAPRCSICGNQMGNTWYYRWLHGQAAMPPVCVPCRKAAK